MKKISNLARVLGPADNAVCERHDCTTLQLFKDNQVISKWVNDNFTVGGKYQKKIGTIQKVLHQWWEQELARPIVEIETYVRHVYREQNKEADHWANVGAVGKKEIVVDKGSNTEKWKAIKGFWDGSCKENGRSGCGVVVEGVDREKWFTITKIAPLLKVCTAMAAEMTGVCLLMSVLNMILHKNLNLGNINMCIVGLIGRRF